MDINLLEKQNQTKAKTTRWREIIKIRMSSIRSRPEEPYKNQ
jgi:hypothetical protein